jgi:hypothetical protein
VLIDVVEYHDGVLDDGSWGCGGRFGSGHRYGDAFLRRLRYGLYGEFGFVRSCWRNNIVNLATHAAAFDGCRRWFCFHIGVSVTFKLYVCIILLLLDKTQAAFAGPEGCLAWSALCGPLV